MKGFKQVACFRRNLIFWKLLGVYPLTISRPWLYNVYAKIFIFFFIVMYSILFTLNLYFIPKYLDNYIKELIFYFTVLSIMSKVLTFLFKKNKIRNIINILESDIFQPESKEGIKIINEAKITNERYWKIYIAVCITSNLVHVLSPLVNYFIFKEELFLPVSSYSFLPDNIKHYFLYPLYFYQSIGMNFHVHFVVNIDNFFVGVMIFLIAQLKVLEKKLTNVTENFKLNTKIPNKEVELMLKLNKIFVHYSEVTKFCSLIEDVFSLPVFIQFAMGSNIICMCLISFTMPATWQYFIFLSTYTFAMVVQILIPCLYGTHIMEESYQLGQAIYSCDWTPRSKRFKSSMRLFVERTKSPLSITGWKMFLLSLSTFTSIMNTAYSFFTVLRQMQ